MVTKPWREYEKQIFEHFKKKYPGTEILFDQKIAGRHSLILRQIDVLVSAVVADVPVRGVFDCKHFQANVDVGVIDGMVGLLDDVDAQFGGVISSSGFSEGAANRARGASPKLDLRVIPFTSVEDVIDQLAPRSGLIYGPGHAFFINEPAGWLLDNKTGVHQGLHAVLYPAGSSWKDAPAAMYVRTDVRAQGDSLEAYVSRDVDHICAKDPTVRVSIEARIPGVGPSVELSGRRVAQVRHFAGRTFDTVAYIEENAVFVVLVLTSRDQQSHDTALPAFRELVESYAFSSENVQIKQ